MFYARRSLLLLLAWFVLPPPVSAAEVTQARLDAALKELEAIATRALEQSGMPGLAIAVVHNDRVVFLRGFGVRQVGGKDAISPDTVFALASVSKPITSTVLAMLVAEGVISWDDRIADLLPGFRLSDPWVTREVRLRDMLCHRSGLPEYAGDTLIDFGFTRGEVLSRLRLERPTGKFRATYAYTNPGFSTAAFAAARAAKMPWEKLIEEKLYRPLGMKSASSRATDYRAAKDRATMHERLDNKWIVTTMDPITDPMTPAGGVYCSLRDITQFLRLHLAGGKLDGKQRIPTAVLEETHRPHIVTHVDEKTQRPTMYGLGWEVEWDEKGRRSLKHNGAHHCARTEIALLPSENLGIAVLCSGFPSGLPEGLRQTFFDLVLEGKPRKDWVKVWNDRYDKLPEMYRRNILNETIDYAARPKGGSPALPLSAYVGKYDNDYAGPAEVAEGKDGTLVLRLRKREFVLRHWDRDMFWYRMDPESMYGPGGLTFQIGADGKAERMVIRLLDRGGVGTFRRVANPKAQE